MHQRFFRLGAALLLPTFVLSISVFVIMDASAARGESNLLLIDAVLYDGLVSGDADESVRLVNLSDSPISLASYQLSDGSSVATLPITAQLAAHSALWLTKDSAAFVGQFGFLPDYEVTNSSPLVPNLSGSWPGFSNSGDEVLLLDADDNMVDCLIYKKEETLACEAGWVGDALEPYKVSNLFAEEGQILYRKRDPQTGLPVPDTNGVADWAQERADLFNGRKVRYPGWDIDAFFLPTVVTETAVLTVAIAPDNAYETLVQHINSAQHTIQIESLTFENAGIANALIAASQRGVAVTVLLEGGPSGGVSDQERYVCQQLEAGGGACWFMINDDDDDRFDRYRFLHAKFILVDEARVSIGSENLSNNSLPYDDKTDGTWGRRGVVLITDAPSVVSYVRQLFAADFDPANHRDLRRWEASDETLGAPPFGFQPVLETGGVTATVRYPEAAVFQGNFRFELVQAPENSLNPVSGLLGLVGQAGAGDMVLVQQLNERPYWGSGSSNPVDDPNLRLEAYLAAARRGATVRLMLDDYFSDPDSSTSNHATCAYVQQVAAAEQLNLDCRLENPAGLGIHNKMVLVELNGAGHIHVGSINGTEQSSKGNRELALQVASDEAYALLSRMFWADWTDYLYLPTLFAGYRGPATHLLISELLYDPLGLDDKEFVEIVNPTAFTVDLSGYSIGDAVSPDDFEDVRRFPDGTELAPQQTLVIAFAASAFEAEFGFVPDFEIVETDTAVPNLIDDPAWGDPAALLQLGNGGDELLLRGVNDELIDFVAYGSGLVGTAVSCPLVTTSGHSLERFPYWRDTNSCSSDFRDWPLPNPGVLP